MAVLLDSFCLWAGVHIISPADEKCYCDIKYMLKPSCRNTVTNIKHNGVYILQAFIFFFRKHQRMLLPDPREEMTNLRKYKLSF